MTIVAKDHIDVGKLAQILLVRSEGLHVRKHGFLNMCLLHLTISFWTCMNESYYVVQPFLILNNYWTFHKYRKIYTTVFRLNG